MKARCLLLGLTIFFSGSMPAGAKGRLPPPPPARYHAWITYFRGPEGFKDWERCGGGLEEVSVFALQFDERGSSVVPATPWVNEAIAHLRSSPHPPARLWLTVVNDRGEGNRSIQKDPGIVHENLETPEARTRHIEDLLPWARSVDGLDIDYENLRGEDSEPFSLFIEELARQLHARGKYLSVTVEPKTDLTPGSQGRAVDWQRVGAAADEVRVMAYFYHYPGGSPGPIAPLSWLSDLARFVRQEVPAEKLSLVLNVNGLDWPPSGVAREIRTPEIAALLADPDVKRRRDSDQTPYFRYRQDGQMHEVWYEDAASLEAKVDYLRRAGVRWIGFWQLGTGDPAFWEGLAKKPERP